MKRLLVLAYGNPLRQDDGAGWHVGQALHERWLAPTGDDANGALVDLQPQLDWAADLSETEVAVFVDAERAPDGKPAALYLRPLRSGDSVGRLLDGHSPVPADLISLARLLYGRAPKAYLLSIPAYHFGYGDGLSAATAAGVDAALDQIEQMARTLEQEAARCV